MRYEWHMYQPYKGGVFQAEIPANTEAVELILRCRKKTSVDGPNQENVGLIRALWALGGGAVIQGLVCQGEEFKFYYKCSKLVVDFK